MVQVEESGLTYAEDLTNMEDPPDPANGHSQIVEFFTGLNVLITGGSGFLGKILIEKLLRSCSTIGKLYMFMRAKKGKTPEQRFHDHFDDPLYVRLKKEVPNFAKKIVLIEADMGLEDMGLSLENRDLIRNTDVIFHGAATVRFDETLRQAGNINIRGTKALLLLAKELPNLKAFVYISTAFSHCPRKYIDEKLYPMSTDANKVLTLLNVLNDEELKTITPTLIDKWPNTYAFTKAVAENAVSEFGKGLPVSIVRPSIVIATYQDPIPGWINNLYGPTGVVVGAGIGLLRSLHCRSNAIADIIPADYVISNIIVAAWDIAQTRSIPPSITNSNSNSGSVKETNEMPIYNVVSACQKPITWGAFMKYNEIYGSEVPSVHVLWYYMFTLNKHKTVHMLFVIFLHMLPALIVDLLALLTGRKPILLKAYRKIHKFSGVISYFATQEWRFKNQNVLELWKKLNTADRAIFNFNLDTLNWEEYFYNHIRCLRIYIAKDPIETLEVARARFTKLKIAHYSLITLISILLIWLGIKFLMYIWSLCL